MFAGAEKRLVSSGRRHGSRWRGGSGGSTGGDERENGVVEVIADFGMAEGIGMDVIAEEGVVILIFPFLVHIEDGDMIGLGDIEHGLLGFVEMGLLAIGAHEEEDDLSVVEAGEIDALLEGRAEGNEIGRLVVADIPGAGHELIAEPVIDEAAEEIFHEEIIDGAAADPIFEFDAAKQGAAISALEASELLEFGIEAVGDDDEVWLKAIVENLFDAIGNHGIGIGVYAGIDDLKIFRRATGIELALKDGAIGFGIADGPAHGDRIAEGEDAVLAWQLGGKIDGIAEALVVIGGGLVSDDGEPMAGNGNPEEGLIGAEKLLATVAEEMEDDLGNEEEEDENENEFSEFAEHWSASFWAKTENRREPPPREGRRPVAGKGVEGSFGQIRRIGWGSGGAALV